MIRALAFVIGVAIVASILTHGNKVAIYAGLAIGAVIVAVPLLTGRSALKCPFCQKRVKLGATVCHHCGRTISQSG